MGVEERGVEVPEDLRAWISEINVATVADHGRGRTVVDEPDHATTIVLRTVPGHGGELVVVGPRTRARYHVGEPGPWCVRARLHTGRAQRLLGRSARELVDEVVTLRTFGDEPADLGSGDEVFARLLAGSLPAGAQDDPRRDRLVREATTLLSSGAGGVAAVARRLHISERHLRNLFADSTGLSPKHFARIHRVRKVLIRTRPWAELAADAGYYDQAHLTGEFRRLMGVAPAAFRRGELPAATRCHAPG